MKVVVIINPMAGNGRTKKLWPAIEPVLKNKIGAFEVLTTSFPEEATVLAQQALEKGATWLIAVGGDGLLNEVLNGMFHNDVAFNPDALLSFVMTGTGCDFQRSFGYSNDWKTAISRMKQEAIRQIDIGKVTFFDSEKQEKVRYFINISSFGISGAVDHCMKNSKARNYLSATPLFFWSTIKILFSHPNQLIRFQIDDEPQEEMETKLVILANGCYFGGGMFAAPNAQLHDGLLDLLLIKKISFVKLLWFFPSIYAGTHLENPFVVYKKIHKFKVITDHKIRLDIDGESPGFLDATFEVLPKALNLQL